MGNLLYILPLLLSLMGGDSDILGRLLSTLGVPDPKMDLRKKQLKNQATQARNTREATKLLAGENRQKDAAQAKLGILSQQLQGRQGLMEQYTTPSQPGAPSPMAMGGSPLTLAYLLGDE